MNPAFLECLLRWYQSAQRSLPWRQLKLQLTARNVDVAAAAVPGNGFILPLEDRQTLAYATWVSEVMSQQTTLGVVIPRFNQFLEILPDVEALARCDEATLRSLWAGLGYYARARNLKKGAEFIASEWHGRFPTSYEDWLRVPGCGPYTAAMVSSVVANAHAAAVDGNVTRVVSRILRLGDATWTSSGGARVQSFVNDLVTHAVRPGDFNQAMMELGALVCRKPTPDCAKCPVSEWCGAFQSGETHLHPPAKPRRGFESRSLAAVVVRAADSDEVALFLRRQGFLSRTQGFPLAPYDGNLASALPAPGVLVKSFSHTITHHKLTVHPVLVRLDRRSEWDAAWREILRSMGCDGEPHWIAGSAIDEALGTSLDRKVWRGVKPLT